MDYQRVCSLWFWRYIWAVTGRMALKKKTKKQLAGLSVKFYEIILSVFDNSNILRFKGLDELYYI